MSRRTRSANRHVYRFRRMAELIPLTDSSSDGSGNSDVDSESDSMDSIHGDSDEETTYVLATTSEPQRRSNSRTASGGRKKVSENRKRKSGRSKSKSQSSSEAGNGAPEWSERIPVELLLRIFQHVVERVGSVPFLCRVSRVCRRWRVVASDPKLWRKVNLSLIASMESLRFSAKADAAIEKLARTRLAAVTVLSLDGWSELTDSSLKVIAKYCPQLQSIILSQCENLSSRAIGAFACHCPKLRMIDVAMTKIDLACLHRLTRRMGKQLEEISLMNCARLRGEMILTVIQENCPNLTVLDLTGTNIRKLNVEKLQAGCPKLQDLLLANLLIHSAPITADMEPTGFPELENLCLACGSSGTLPMPDQLLQRILRTSENLKSLDIRRLHRVSPEGLRSLPVISLGELLLSETQATQATVSAVIEKWHDSLEVLELSSNPRVGDGAMELLGTFEMPRLRSLDLAGTNVTIEGVRKAVNGCPNLKDLNLACCRGVPRDMKHRHEGGRLVVLKNRLTQTEQPHNTQHESS